MFKHYFYAKQWTITWHSDEIGMVRHSLGTKHRVKIKSVISSSRWLKYIQRSLRNTVKYYLVLTYTLLLSGCRIYYTTISVCLFAKCESATSPRAATPTLNAHADVTRMDFISQENFPSNRDCVLSVLEKAHTIDIITTLWIYTCFYNF